MKGIDFPQANQTFKGPPGSGIYDLRVYNDGRQSIAFFEATEHDLERIRANGGLWLSVAAGTQFPPVAIMVDSPFPSSPDSWMRIPYWHDLTQDLIWVYNTRDAAAPEWFKLDGLSRTYKRDRSRELQPVGREAFIQRQTYYLRDLAVDELPAANTAGTASELQAALCKALVGGMGRALQEETHLLTTENWVPRL